MNGPQLSLGQKVELNDSRTGVLRFLGKTDFSAGDWVGVELQEATGKNDGAVQGKRYFECEPQHGIFCRATGISRILEEAKSKPTAVVNGAHAKAKSSNSQGGVNSIRTQTLQQESGPGRRASTLHNTPTPAGRPVSGIRSAVKSPTKQPSTNGNSGASISRTGTPPVAGKGVPQGIAAKSSRTSISSSNATASRRTSIFPSAASESAQRTTRQPATSSTSSRTATSRVASGTTSPTRRSGTTRSSIRQVLTAAKTEPSFFEAGEQSSAVSPRESTGSEAASASESAAHAKSEGGEEYQGDTATVNFAPPPVPPIPPEHAIRTGKQRRPSSPSAASVHSQRTIRSTAAAGRQIEELEAKLRVAERKRLDDRESKQNLEKAEQERDQFKAIIEKLQNKYRPQQQEMELLKKELADSERHLNELEESQARHELELESALVDREYAEEKTEQLEAELAMLRDQSESDRLELEILKEENRELSKEMSPEERTSAGWMQLEKSNERLREALLRFRDMAHEEESRLKEQIDSLEKDVQHAEELQAQCEEIKAQLLQSQADTEDLRQQLEVAEGAEDMIEQLTEDNQSLRDKINDLRNAVDDLEALRELNDELEVNHVEAEKQLQEEIDFKDSLLRDREQIAKEQQTALDEADYNINRFRELVGHMQSDLQDLEASKQISESEAAQLSNKSKAMMELNQKLQSTAAKTQVKTIDLELRKLDAQEASEHLGIVQLFLPEMFQAERESVLSLLRFKRISFKAGIVQSFVKERIASFENRDENEEVFSACDVVEKLTWVAGMAMRLINSISSCSVEAFEQYGSALHELEVVERTLNDFIDLLRRDDLKEGDMSVRLGRSIEVMTHLSGLHLHNGLADHADDLVMRSQVLQSSMDSTTLALNLIRILIEKNLRITNSADELKDDSDSDTTLILNRLRSLTELARNSKIMSGKTYRALTDLQARSLTLEESFLEQFENVGAAGAEIAAYAFQSGSALKQVFDEEGREESFTASEVTAILSQTANKVFTLSAPEPGPCAALADRLRDLSTLLAELSSLPTDLDNTVEFERSPAPWVARADQLKQTKIVSVDTEAELARTQEAVSERESVIKQKDTELEEQSVRIEMLEARIKDASKRSAKIAELERNLREAKATETQTQHDLAQIRHQAQQDVERVRSEMARLADERRNTSTGKDLDSNAMGTSVRTTLKHQEHTIAGLQSAVRYLKEDNYRLRLPPPVATLTVQAGLDWLYAPLQTTDNVTRTKPYGAALHREGEKILEQMLALAGSSPSVDLTKIPENKLAWRPVKESSRWRVERRNEQWTDWKQWREEVVRRASVAPLQNLAA